ncbi:sterol homeostasis protein ARV1 [Lachancea thermotolerans CBS 6340]|uniref:Protein ARV n=1 Tax=Lachancea thermotolerans (strain ATCC 56472 / CBS 6340 / NRRL Y-8284) TaxID=559295 RepID=C5DKY2_LACTC|nr:KLTH0F08448p [Lachancea thermotolerans CBS 6340]CAR24133.1 KLTH0F08448p [Lachancea thermotolerans CBS 6340]
MICINCCCEVDCLYVEYSNNHIRLTDCAKCKEVVDRYVEFDNVLLFIDLLLLKPGAYRHLVYNSLELELSKYPERKHEFSARTWKQRSLLTLLRLRDWFVKFDKLNRVWILITAFEVYLTWVSEERNYAQSNSNELIEFILSRSALSQYLCFAIYCVADFVLLCGLTHYFLVKWFKWGRKVKYSKHVVSYTILLSYGVKIFPFLMLIWPYDTLLSTNIVKLVSNAYIIEALKVVTNLAYSNIIFLYVVVFLVRWISVRPLLCMLVTEGDIQFCGKFMEVEYKRLLRRLLRI